MAPVSAAADAALKSSQLPQFIDLYCWSWARHWPLTGCGKISSAAKSDLSALAEDESAKKSLNVSQWIHLRFFRALIFIHHQNLEFLATKPFFRSLLRVMRDF
jgi:hypothetical protein